jgi:hypothetical protein
MTAGQAAEKTGVIQGLLTGELIFPILFNLNANTIALLARQLYTKKLMTKVTDKDGGWWFCNF